MPSINMYNAFSYGAHINDRIATITYYPFMRERFDRDADNCAFIIETNLQVLLFFSKNSRDERRKYVRGFDVRSLISLRALASRCIYIKGAAFASLCCEMRKGKRERERVAGMF